MEIVGKEFKKRLVNSKVEVTHFLKVKCNIHSDITRRIWERRKCFICGGKFKDGDNPVVVFTKKEWLIKEGKSRKRNRIICEKCYLGLKRKIISPLFVR